MLLRSPTAAFILSQEPYNYNTRAVGINAEYALVAIDNVHISWADEIVVMELWMQEHIEGMLKSVFRSKTLKLVCLNIPDNFPYRDPELIDLIKNRYDGWLVKTYQHQAAALDEITEISEKLGLYDKEQNDNSN